MSDHVLEPRLAIVGHVT